MTLFEATIVEFCRAVPAGLRALQGRKQLEQLVRRVQAQRDSMRWGPAGPPPLLVKARCPPLTASIPKLRSSRSTSASKYGVIEQQLPLPALSLSRALRTARRVHMQCTLSPARQHRVTLTWSATFAATTAKQSCPGYRPLRRMLSSFVPSGTSFDTTAMQLQIAPDLTEEERADIASLALRLRIDGLVVSNTTVSRSPAVLAQEHGREVRASLLDLTSGLPALPQWAARAQGREAHCYILLTLWWVLRSQRRLHR